MSNEKEHIRTSINRIVDEWIANEYLQENDIFVVGCSTSEVAGEKIGTSGSEEIAKVIYDGLDRLRQTTGVHLAFQCCEHLNRALVIERDTLNLLNNKDVVTVIPHPDAGGSMASYAYKQMNQPAVIEEIRASAGMDIGDTMIGMHLKHVAVPLRFEQKMVGDARVTGARTRPKLIGGERAVYR